MHTDPLSRVVVERIQAARTDAGISIDQLADAAGIPRVTVQRKLKGVGSLTLDQFVAITAALDLDPREVLAGAA